MRLRASEVFRRLGLEAQAYVVVFIAIMFSGSLYGRFVPYLILVEIALLLWMGVSMPFKKATAYFNGRGLTQAGILVVFCLFLAWQVSFAHAPSVTQVYVQRFFLFAVLLILVPRPEVWLCAIKGSKYYALAVAVSIIVIALVTGESTGGLVGNYQFGGMMMSVACILFLIDYFYQGGRQSDIVGLSLALAGLFISGKRMFTLLAALAFVLLYLLSRKKQGSVKAARLLLAGAGIVVPLYLLLEPVRQLVVRLGLLSLDEYAATSGRNLLWGAAIEVFRSHSLVGIGFGNFAVYLREAFHIEGVHENLTHNIYYGLLAETGVVGLGLILGLMATSLAQSWRLLRVMRDMQDELGQYVMAFSIAMQVWFIVYGFTGNGIYDWHEFFFYISALAMMISVGTAVAAPRPSAEKLGQACGDQP